MVSAICAVLLTASNTITLMKTQVQTKFKTIEQFKKAQMLIRTSNNKLIKEKRKKFYRKSITPCTRTKWTTEDPD